MAALEGVPVAPELLRFIDSYVQEVDVNDAVRLKEMDADSNLLEFCRGLYAQLLAGTMQIEITAIDARNGARVRAARRAVDDSGWPDGLRRLIDRFPSLCKLHPDLLGATYSPSEGISELHFDLIPTLLGDLSSAAAEAGPADLAVAAADARELYAGFLDNFDLSNDD